ncbi:MAG: hypothetical protein WDZ83_02205 [Rhizobiaceae bacterium]
MRRKSGTDSAGTPIALENGQVDSTAVMCVLVVGAVRAEGMMRIILVVFWSLALTSLSGGAERSFTLQGESYQLNLLPELKFAGRDGDGAEEIVLFESKEVILAITSYKFDPDYVGMLNTEAFLYRSTERGDYNLKAIGENGFSLYGGCGSDDKYCSYVVERAFPEREKWLRIVVGCNDPCDDNAIRASGELTDQLAAQLRNM